MAPRTSIWSPAPKPLHTSFSPRHTLRLTRITPTRFVVAFNDSRSANVTTSLAYRAPPTAAPLSPASPPSGGQSPFAEYLWRPRCSVQPTDEHLVYRLARRQLQLYGIGGYKSTTPTDPTSWTHFCVHTNCSDDRESGWADNNPIFSSLRNHERFMEQLQCWHWRSPGHVSLLITAQRGTPR